MKIGGAVLRNKEGFDALLNIISSYCPNPTIFVFSALSDFSRRLKSIAKLAPNSKFPETLTEEHILYEDAVAIAKSVLASSNNLAKCLEQLSDTFAEIEKILFGVAVTHELTPRILDKILSYGEYISSIILENFFSSNKIRAKILDAGEVIITDQNFNNANPIFEVTSRRVKSLIPPLFKEFDYIFIQGFIGRSQNGYPTTMGFESSNLTALLIAEILSSKKVVFWTDVEGIRTADPKLVKNTILINELSIADAKRASENGLKLVHPKMIDYFGNFRNTDFYYCSAFNPENGKTKIVENSSQKKLPLIITNIMDELEFAMTGPKLTNLKESKDRILVKDSSEQLEIREQVGLITILNAPIPKVLSFLSCYSFNFKYLFVDHSENIIKIVVGPNEFPEFSNQLHKEIVSHHK